MWIKPVPSYKFWMASHSPKSFMWHSWPSMTLSSLPFFQSLWAGKSLSQGPCASSLITYPSWLHHFLLFLIFSHFLIMMTLLMLFLLCRMPFHYISTFLTLVGDLCYMAACSSILILSQHSDQPWETSFPVSDCERWMELILWLVPEVGTNPRQG